MNRWPACASTSAALAPGLFEVPGAPNQIQTWDYDALNRVAVATDAEGFRTTYGYDAMGPPETTTIARRAWPKNAAPCNASTRWAASPPNSAAKGPRARLRRHHRTTGGGVATVRHGSHTGRRWPPHRRHRRPGPPDALLVTTVTIAWCSASMPESGSRADPVQRVWPGRIHHRLWQPARRHARPGHSTGGLLDDVMQTLVNTRVDTGGWNTRMATAATTPAARWCPASTATATPPMRCRAR